MGKRFVPPSYKQELYLNITSLNQENLKVEKDIREFAKLQIRVGLNEESLSSKLLDSLRDCHPILL